MTVEAFIIGIWFVCWVILKWQDIEIGHLKDKVDSERSQLFENHLKLIYNQLKIMEVKGNMNEINNKNDE